MLGQVAQQINRTVQAMTPVTLREGAEYVRLGKQLHITGNGRTTLCLILIASQFTPFETKSAVRAAICPRCVARAQKRNMVTNGR